MIIWLTGIPASGKTTIAGALVKHFQVEPKTIVLENSLKTPFGTSVSAIETAYKVIWLDGDALRDSDFARGVGFTQEERDAHVLRVGYMARVLNWHVGHVVCSLVSPSESVRARLGVDLMVHVDCPVDVAVQRDPKGLYAKAARGEIKNLTGWDAPYEAPLNPDVYLDTSILTVDECVTRILEARL